MGIDRRSERQEVTPLLASSEFAKCQVMAYGGYMMMYENKAYLAPDGPYKHNDPGRDSQPLQIVIHRYPHHHHVNEKFKGEKRYGGKRPICQMYFEYDFVYCEE